MRQRTEVGIALGIASLLIVIAYASGTRARPEDDVDRRASTFNTGRDGARALADVAERMGVTVERSRLRTPQLTSRVTARVRDSAVTKTIAVLDPPAAIGRSERKAFLGMATARYGANLILAGRSASALYDCLGYHVESTLLDSLRVASPGRDADATAPYVHDRFVLGKRKQADDEESATDADSRADRCPPILVNTTDTLMVTTRGDPVMLALTVIPRGRRVVLVSDGALVRNRALRTGATGALVAGALIPRTGSLVFDEFHQGYVEGGSITDAVLAWSKRNPLGWMLWQWCVLGLIALAAGAVRFGPVRAVIPRARRSSLEHVRALATALAASRGHRTAVRAMVRGLERRLAPGRTAHSAGRDDWRRYLASLRTHAPNPQVQASAEQLERLADHPESDSAVLSAANAVEDLWHSLRP